MTDERAHTGEDLACIEEVELITDLLEGALSEAERRGLEAHLAGCEGCAEYVEQMRTVAGALGGLRADLLPARLRDELIATFRRFGAAGRNGP